jgi:hypothetical protein
MTTVQQAELGSGHPPTRPPHRISGETSQPAGVCCASDTRFPEKTEEIASLTPEIWCPSLVVLIQ